MKLRPVWLLTVACAPFLVLTACGADSAARSGTIRVLAAASLTDAFDELAKAFAVANPDVTVELNFASSSTLREQILAGAPADVFASADPANMDAVVDGGSAMAPVDFVKNQLQIAVPAGNPASVAGLADFADGELLIGLCAEEVPCGRFARQALANAGVVPAIDTNEPDVRSLLTKIEAGELDAGIVYRTDVLSAGDTVEGIDIPTNDNVISTYQIAVLTEADNDGNNEATARELAAEAFVAFVLSDEGQGILASYGFGAP